MSKLSNLIPEILKEFPTVYICNVIVSDKECKSGMVSAESLQKADMFLWDGFKITPMREGAEIDTDKVFQWSAGHNHKYGTVVYAFTLEKDLMDVSEDSVEDELFDDTDLKKNADSPNTVEDDQEDDDAAYDFDKDAAAEKDADEDAQNEQEQDGESKDEAYDRSDYDPYSDEFDEDLDDVYATPYFLVKRAQMFMKEWSPQKIKEYLDTYIESQNDAKRAMAYLCYEHVARIAYPDLHIRKNNYVMFGPTGSGKTEIARVIREILPVPIEIVDASSITKSGFQGLEKEELMFSLQKDHPMIEYGIIVLDEFDKLCVPNFSSGGDNVNKLIQGELLKMIEGTTMRKEIRKRGVKSMETMNTEHITFICAGAFVGLMDPDPSSKKIGFMTVQEEKKHEQALVIDNLMRFGMIPELAGRIGNVIRLHELTEDDLYRIMTTKKNNSLESTRNLYRIAYNKDLRFEEAALRKIAQKAIEYEIGARGLNGVIEHVCHNALVWSDEENAESMKTLETMVCGDNDDSEKHQEESELEPLIIREDDLEDLYGGLS